MSRVSVRPYLVTTDEDGVFRVTVRTVLQLAGPFSRDAFPARIAKGGPGSRRIRPMKL